MRKTILTVLGTLLIAGSAVQMASATEHTRKTHRTPAAAGDTFLNANNASEGRVNGWCQSSEPGNPYNPQTDYQQWSAWRENGSWDSRNDCR
jgi:hypothetical protein